jgi:hypothetical protein
MTASAADVNSDIDAVARNAQIFTPTSTSATISEADDAAWRSRWLEEASTIGKIAGPHWLRRMTTRMPATRIDRHAHHRSCQASSCARHQRVSGLRRVCWRGPRDITSKEATPQRRGPIISSCWLSVRNDTDMRRVGLPYAQSSPAFALTKHPMSSSKGVPRKLAAISWPQPCCVRENGRSAWCRVCWPVVSGSIDAALEGRHPASTVR